MLDPSFLPARAQWFASSFPDLWRRTRWVLSPKDLWCQIFADVLGCPIKRLRVHDSAALGAALLGAVGAGIYPSMAEAAAATVAVDKVFTPSRPLDDLYPVYRDSYDALRHINARLV